jgi:hypothetical protein
MHIYGLDLYNVDTALSVRYELKSKKKNDAVKISPFTRQVIQKKWDIWYFER